MSTQAPRTLQPVRTVLLAIGFLLSTSLLGVGPVAAGVLNPAIDVGVPGGGGSGLAITSTSEMDLLANCLCVTAS